MLSKNQIKEIQSLHLKKHRDSKKLFIAEGTKTVVEIIGRHLPIVRHVYCTNDFIKNESAVKLLPLNTYTEITTNELQKISLQATPNQVLAVCDYFKENESVIDPGKQFTLYLDDVRDPGNFGTIVRLADWFGIRQIFCSPASCDIYNPKVIQATMGSFLRVEVIYIELEKILQNKSVKVYGAILSGKDIYNEKLSNGLIVVGNEANGINEDNLKKITHPITIPSANNQGSESLNVAMASSIIVSEFFRQLNKA